MARTLSPEAMTVLTVSLGSTCQRPWPVMDFTATTAMHHLGHTLMSNTHPRPWLRLRSLMLNIVTHIWPRTRLHGVAVLRRHNGLNSITRIMGIGRENLYLTPIILLGQVDRTMGRTCIGDSERWFR